MELRTALQSVGWCLNTRTRSILATDLDLLAAGLRPLLMLDYLPECTNQLQLVSSFVRKVWKASSPWRILHLGKCLYLLHTHNLIQYMQVSLSAESWLKFVILDNGPPRLATEVEAEDVKTRLKTVQARVLDILTTAEETTDLGRVLSDLELCVPTLNGWLLGYPVIYTFSSVEQATRCISFSGLYLYRLHLRSPSEKTSGSVFGDVLCFTVPSSHELEDSEAIWKEEFMSYMKTRAESCSIDPRCLCMEVSSKPMQSVAF